MDLMNAIDVVKAELKCVQNTDCNHDCGYCGLFIDQSRIVSALNFVLDMLYHEEAKMQHQQRELGSKLSACSSVNEPDFASIEFRPVCSYCHEVLYSEVSADGFSIYPSQCPICGHPIDRICMPTRLPVSVDTYS